MNDDEFDKWAGLQRVQVIEYLTTQGIISPNVGEWPAFDVAPYFAIWAVESKEIEEKIGWWAFSGDCPTDYVTEKGECHPRAALGYLIDSWKGYIPHMRAGRQPPATKFGKGTDLEELGSLLEKRISVFEEWYSDDDLWADL